MCAMSVSLRAMGHADIGAGLRLCRACQWNQVEDDWRYFLDLEYAGCHLALREDVVLGTVAFLRYGRIFSWIAMMLVDPQARRAGIASGLMKQGKCPAPMAADAVRTMSALNASAAKTAREFGDAIHAATDVTGFGLAGHASEMCGGASGNSGISLEIPLGGLPLLDGLGDYLAHLPMLKKLGGGFHTGGATRNLDAFGAGLDWGEGGAQPKGTLSVHKFAAAPAEIALDPQTSGGLLFAVAPDSAEPLLQRLVENGCPAARRIGRFIPAAADGKRIYFIP